MPLTTITVRVAANTATAAAAFTDLGDQGRAMSASMAKSFTDVTVSVNTFENNMKGMSTRVAAIGSFLGNVFADIARAGVRWLGQALGSVFSDAIKYSKEYNDSLVGLTSVSRAFGITSESALAAAKGLSADGLLPLGASAKGLKNLLMTGFGLKESIDIMNAFKDSATFARQSTYTFSEAIVTATEGLKNSMSRMVDNVGITKNLSVIMKEAGYQLQDLTDKTKGAGARQALYTGLLREAVAQQGDAARSLKTYSGQMNVLDSSYKSLVATWGDVITRSESVMLVLKALGEWMRKLTESLATNRQGFYLVSDAIILTAKSLSVLLGVIDLLQTAYNGLRQVSDAVMLGLSKAMIPVAQAQEKLFKAMALAQEAFSPGLAAIFRASAVAAKESFEFLSGSLEGYRIDMEDATQDSIKWGNKIQEAKAEVDRLTKELEKSRGKMIDLGAASRAAGDQIDHFAGATDKAAKTAKAGASEVRAEVNQMANLILAIERMMTAEQDAAIKAMKAEIKAVNDRIVEAGRRWAEVQKIIDQVAKEQFKIGSWFNPQDMKKAVDPMEEAFGALARDLPKKISEAFRTNSSMFVAVFTSITETFGKVFEKRLQQALEKNVDLTSLEKQLGYLAVGFAAALAGFSIGQQTASKSKGVLGGAAAGAAAGLPLAPFTGGLSVLVGAGIGGLAGLFGGIFGGKKKFNEEMKQLREAKQALLDQYGGYEKLKKAADAVGLSIDAAFNATTITSFNAAVKVLNQGFADSKERIAALGNAMDAINTRAKLFAKPFQDLTTEIEKQRALQKDAEKEGDPAKATAAAEAAKSATAKLAETAQRSQAAFERLGIFARDAFAGIIREGGSAYDALMRLAPTLQILKDGVETWGLSSTAIIDELLANFRLLNDEGLKPLFDSIFATGEILKGLMDANALSPEGFQAAAADVGASIQGIIDKGGDAARTLALSQPVLQQLWEAQQRYGTITDETTQKILQQAEEQGLVGDQFKDINKQILDVLLAIGDVLGAKIPDYLKKLPKTAQTAADGVKNAFENAKPEVEVKVKMKWPERPDGDGTYTPAGPAGVPTFGRGGIVRRATLAIVGERGPEAIIPLSGGALGVSGSYITEVYLDGERIARSTAKRMPKILRSVGVG